MMAGETRSLEQTGDVPVAGVVEKEKDATMAFGDATTKATSTSDKTKVVEELLLSAHEEQLQMEWAARLAFYEN